ncbi:MAG: hypothetical protein CSA81_13180 [Acidobacteria bacterium]|nr:MAG: hypothetical protein CSA81_13180 [Acidobacteriota bacterium]
MESNVEQVQQIQKILQIILRRRVILLFFLLSALTICIGFYLTQDKIYKASALIIYQQQKVNPAKMSPEERGKLANVVSTLSPLIMSRTNLESIIESQKLFIKERESKSMYDVVSLMREQIEITPSRRGNTFTVSYSDKNPQVVARVTNIIAGKFVEENLRQRQDRAVETSNYTQDELDMAKQALDRKELILRDFKLKYYNEMPEQRQDNINRLTALQEHYQSKQESIQDLKKTRVLIHEQINGRRQILEHLASMEAPSQQTMEVTKTLTPQDELLQLKQLRNTLRQRYTEKHPKLKILNKKIAALEKIVAAELSPVKQLTVEDNLDDSETVTDKVLFDLKLQLKDISLNIEKITKEMAGIEKQITKYERWIASTPMREAEWAAISREYGELKKHYDFLVAQNLQARSVMNLERNQKGSQFKIKDTARVPQKPEKPDFLKYLLMAFIAGLGLGGGVALSLEFLDTSFRNPEDLEQAFGIDVIACIPQYSLPQEKRKRKRKYLLEGVFFSLWTLGLLTIIVVLWSMEKIII